MGNFFSKKQSKISKQDEAVLQLKQIRDKLKLYQKKIDNQIEHDRLVAKKLLELNKKDKALLLLRKKKYQESLIDKSQNQLENILKLIDDIEFTQIETQVVKGLDEGNKALKCLHQFLNLENVESILDETRESIEYQKEIDSLISGGLTAEEELDIEKELDELLLLSLPDVPTSELSVTKASKDKRVQKEHVQTERVLLTS